MTQRSVTGSAIQLFLMLRTKELSFLKNKLTSPTNTVKVKENVKQPWVLQV